MRVPRSIRLNRSPNDISPSAGPDIRQLCILFAKVIIIIGYFRADSLVCSEGGGQKLMQNQRRSDCERTFASFVMIFDKMFIVLYTYHSSYVFISKYTWYISWNLFQNKIKCLCIKCEEWRTFVSVILDDSSKKMFSKYILGVNVLTKLFSISKFVPRNLEFRASFPRHVRESRQ